MRNLTKHALYKMAVSNTPDSQTGPQTLVLGQQAVQVQSLNHKGIPDGRLLNGAVQAVKKEWGEDDGISVSQKAIRGTGTSPNLDKSSVKQRLGHNSLSFLTQSYLDQQVMNDDETHRVRRKFNGLRAV